MSLISDALAEAYSPDELRASRKAILDAMLSPDSLTGEQLDGVSFSFQPRDLGDLEAMMVHLRAALAVADGDTTTPSNVRGRFIDFSTRQIE